MSLYRSTRGIRHRGIRLVRVWRKEGRQRALEMVNPTKTKTSWGEKGTPLVLITEAEVGSEHLPGMFQGRSCYYMKYNWCLQSSLRDLHFTFLFPQGPHLKGMYTAR